MKLSYSKLLTLWVLALSVLVPKMWADDHDVEVYLDDGVWTIADGSGTVLASDANWDFVEAVNASFTHLTADRTEKEKVIIRDDGVIPPHNSTPLRAIQIPSFTIMDFEGVVRVEDTGEPLTAPLRATWAESIEIINFHLEGNPRYGIWFRGVKDVHFHNVHMDLTAGLGFRIDDTRNEHGSDPNNILLDGRSNNIQVDYAYIRGSGGHGFETYGVDGLTVGTIDTVNTGYAGVLLNFTRNATIDRVYAVNAGSGTGYAGFRTANTNGPNINVGEVIVRGGGRGIFSVSNSGGVTIDWIDIEGMESHGILLEDAQGWHIKGGIIRNTGAQGLRVTSTANHWDSQNNIIENVVIRETQSPSRMSHGLQETGGGTENNQYLNLDLRNSGQTEMAVLDSTDITGTITSDDPAPTPNAEVSLVEGDWVFVNNDTSVDGNFGGDMVAAVQAALDSLTAARTVKERVVIHDSGTIGPNFDSEIVGIVVDSYTTLDFAGTITVADEADPTIIPIIIDEAYQVEIENLHVVGNARHGVWVHGSVGVILGNIMLELETVSVGGSGIRIESSEGVQSENIRLLNGAISGTTSHGVEIFDLHNVLVENLVTEDTGAAGLLLDNTYNTWVRSLEAHNPGAYAGLAIVNGSGGHIRVTHLEVHGGIRGLIGIEGSSDVGVHNVHIEGVSEQGIVIEDSNGFFIGGGLVLNSGAEGILLESTDAATYGATANNHIEYVVVTDYQDTPTQTYGILEVGSDVDYNTYFRNDLRNAGTVADIELVGENSVSVQNTLTGGEEPGQYDAEVYLYGSEWVAQVGTNFVYWGDDFLTAVQTAVDNLDASRTSKASVVVWDAGSIGPYPAADNYIGIRLPSNTILDVRETLTVEDDIGIIVPVIIDEAEYVEVWNLHVEGTARHGIWVRSSSDVEFENVRIDIDEIDSTEIVHIPPFAQFTTAHGNGADTTLMNDGQSGGTSPTSTHGGSGGMNHRIYDDVRMRMPMIRFDVSDYQGVDFSEASITLDVSAVRARDRNWTIWALSDPDLQDWDEMTTSYANFGGTVDAPLGYYELDDTKWTNLGVLPVGGTNLYTTDPENEDIATFLEDIANGTGLATFLFISTTDNNGEWSVISKEGAVGTRIAPTLTLPNAIPADWEAGPIGQAILVDDFWGPRSADIHFSNIIVGGSAYQGIALHYVDSFDIEGLQVTGQSDSALFAYDSHDGYIEDLVASGGLHGVEIVNSTEIVVLGADIENTEEEGIYIEDSQGVLVQSSEIRNAGIAGIHLASTGEEGRSPSTGNIIQSNLVVDDRDPKVALYGIAETGSGTDDNRIMNNDLRGSAADQELVVAGLNTVASGNLLTDGDQDAEFHAQVFWYSDVWVAESAGEVLYADGDLFDAVQAAINSLSADRTEMETVVVWDGGSVGPYEWADEFKTIMVPSYTSLHFRGAIHVDDEVGMIIPLWLQEVEHVEIVNLELTGAPRYGIWIQSSSDIHLGNIDMDLVAVDSLEAVQGAPVRTVTTAAGMGADTYLGNDTDWGRGGPDGAFGGFTQMRLRDQSPDRIRLPMMRFDVSQFDTTTLTEATLSLNVLWTHGSNPGDMVTVYGLVDNSLANWSEGSVTFNNFNGISASGTGYYNLNPVQWVELGQMFIGGSTTVYTSDPDQLNLDTFLAGRSGTVTFLLAMPGNGSGTRDWDLEAKDNNGSNPPTLTVPNAQYSSEADIERDSVGYGIRIDDGLGTRSGAIHAESIVIRGSSNHGLGAYGVDGITIESIHTQDTGGAGVAFIDVNGEQIDYLHVRGGAAGFYARGSSGVVIGEVDIEGTDFFGAVLVDSQAISINGGRIANTDGVGVQVESTTDSEHPSTGNTVQDLRIVDDRATRHQTYGIRELGAGTDSNTYANNDLIGAGTVADISLVGANSVSDGNTLSPDLDTWFGWAVDDQQRVDAGPMGRFYVGNSPWVYSYSLGRYIYISEDFSVSGGTWFFLPMFGQQ